MKKIIGYAALAVIVIGGGYYLLKPMMAPEPVVVVAAPEAVKIGILVGFTGPLESMAPGMADGAELAMKEVSDSGKFLGGLKIESVRADSTCGDAAVATVAAERLVSSDKVAAIVGGDCSGITMAVLNNVAIPNGIAMVSPSATSPGLTTHDDKGLFFRTSPSDARQGFVLSSILKDRGITQAAVTYTNNDYGKGLADSFISNFTSMGGTVTISAAHEDGKGDYSAEVAALSAAGGEILAVFGYVDQGGVGIIRASVDTGAFSTFLLGDGMYSDGLIAAIGDDLNGTIGALPWSEGAGSDAFVAISEAAGNDPDGPFRRESYDAAALIAMAMQKGGEATSAAVAANLMDVANAPGEPILPGQLGKAMEILAAGGDVDYVGATNVELIGPGEASGTYREYIVQDGAFVTVKMR